MKNLERGDALGKWERGILEESGECGQWGRKLPPSYKHLDCIFHFSNGYPYFTFPYLISLPSAYG